MKNRKESIFNEKKDISIFKGPLLSAHCPVVGGGLCVFPIYCGEKALAAAERGTGLRLEQNVARRVMSLLYDGRTIVLGFP